MAKGYLKVIEKVPVQFVRRGGDWVQEGGNNTLIVMGTDRAAPDGPASIDDGLGTVDAEDGGRGAGTIIFVVGRHDLEGGNPDINGDDATIYISQKTDIDNNIGTTFETTDKGPAAVVISDLVRFVFRNNLKIASAVSATHAFLDGDHLRIDMQGKAKVSLDVDGDASEATIDVQDNTIVVKSDGSITITAKDKVVVNAKSSVEVNCDTATVSAQTSVKIDSPDTTVTKALHVGGPADFGANVDIVGPTTVGATLAVAAVASVGGISGPSGGAIPGDVKASGDVQGSGGGTSLNQHNHLVPGVKGGPEVANALNIAASVQLAADIEAARKAAEEAARKAAEEEAARIAAEEEAQRRAAEEANQGDGGTPPDFSGGG